MEQPTGFSGMPDDMTFAIVVEYGGVPAILKLMLTNRTYRDKWAWWKWVYEKRFGKPPYFIESWFFAQHNLSDEYKARVYRNLYMWAHIVYRGAEDLTMKMIVGYVKIDGEKKEETVTLSYETIKSWNPTSLILKDRKKDSPLILTFRVISEIVSDFDEEVTKETLGSVVLKATPFRKSLDLSFSNESFLKKKLRLRGVMTIPEAYAHFKDVTKVRLDDDDNLVVNSIPDFGDFMMVAFYQSSHRNWRGVIEQLFKEQMPFDTIYREDPFNLIPNYPNPNRSFEERTSDSVSVKYHDVYVLFGLSLFFSSSKDLSFIINSLPMDHFLSNVDNVEEILKNVWIILMNGDMPNIYLDEFTEEPPTAMEEESEEMTMNCSVCGSKPSIMCCNCNKCDGEAHKWCSDDCFIRDPHVNARALKKARQVLKKGTRSRKSSSIAAPVHGWEEVEPFLVIKTCFNELNPLKGIDKVVKSNKIHKGEYEYHLETVLESGKLSLLLSVPNIAHTGMRSDKHGMSFVKEWRFSDDESFGAKHGKVRLATGMPETYVYVDFVGAKFDERFGVRQLRAKDMKDVGLCGTDEYVSVELYQL